VPAPRTVYVACPARTSSSTIDRTDQLQRELIAAQQKAASAASKVEDLETAFQGLQKKFEESEYKRFRGLDELAEMKERLEEMAVPDSTVEQLAALEKLVEDLEKQRKAVTQEMQWSRKSLSERNTQLQANEVKLRRSDEQIKKRDDEIHALEEEVRRLRLTSSSGVLDAKVREAFEKGKQQGQQEKGDQIADLQKALAEAEEDRDAARRQIDALETAGGENAELAGEIKRLQQQLDEEEAKVDQLQKAHRQELRDLEQRLGDQDGQLEQVSQLKMEVTTHEAEIERLSADLAAVEEDLAAARAESEKNLRAKKDLEQRTGGINAAASRPRAPSKDTPTTPTKVLRAPSKDTPTTPTKATPEAPKPRRVRPEGDMDARVEAMMRQQEENARRARAKQKY